MQFPGSPISVIVMGRDVSDVVPEGWREVETRGKGSWGGEGGVYL